MTKPTAKTTAKAANAGSAIATNLIDYQAISSYKEAHMFQAPEQLVALNKASLDATAHFGRVAFDGVERMMDVHMKNAKGAFAGIVQHAKTISEIKDLQELAQLKNAFAEPMMEKATGYFRSVYDVAAATHSEIGRLVEEQAGEFNKHVVTNLDKFVKSAPPGSEVAVATVKSAITAVNTAFDNLSKAARQFAEITQANFETASQQAVHATKKKTA
jgi:phasin family protein